MTPAPNPHRASAWPDALSRRTVLMGILNVTPDSFSDGGDFIAAEVAIARAQAIVAEGADILDIGGESTRPGAAPVPAADEIARVVPVIRAVAPRIGVPVSIDTFKAETARAALAAGARIVNDVWGLQRDADMAGVVAESGAGLCIMHNRDHEDYPADVLADIEAFFARSLDIARKAGIGAERIVLDPGIGFGKTGEQNLIVLRNLSRLKRFGFPLLVGCSRKRFIGTYSGRTDPKERLHGSIGAHVTAVMNGAAIIRAHDVAPHREALALVDAVRQAPVFEG